MNRRPRVLVLATTTGYQTRSFDEAAERLNVRLVYATDRCHMLEDPWRDEAIPIRFHEEEASTDAIVRASEERRIDGIIAVGDKPTPIAARVAARLGLPGHPLEAVVTARDKARTRARLREAGLPVPWFTPLRLDADPAPISRALTYPCVLKPVNLSGSRGVMRADGPQEFVAAFERLRALVRLPDLQAERDEGHERALVEGFVPGREFAVEGVVHEGVVTVLAVFDKPDPLDGPFFEETIYVTPPALEPDEFRQVVEGVSRAAAAIGLRHGPIHGECRLNADGVCVLEVAARPIGGLCARALRFEHHGGGPLASLEELLLRHAIGESPETWRRESCASGVMMIPIPERGVFRGVDGEDRARQVGGIEEIAITAKADQMLVPLPEGASYLGFIFARAATSRLVEQALRDAHACLRFTIQSPLPVAAVR